MIGTTLSHYRILEKLGQGGMGVVYSAEDRTLGRQVVIKVLPDEFAPDPERVARFELEARMLAYPSRQNIASILGLEQVEGKRSVVMEVYQKLKELSPGELFRSPGRDARYFAYPYVNKAQVLPNPTEVSLCANLSVFFSLCLWQQSLYLLVTNRRHVLRICQAEIWTRRQ